jgi:nicotinamide mononucleotide transporter
MEIAANAITTLSIIAAARNSVHTWWLGIIGCVLFVIVFVGVQLYADATLQIFFIGSSAAGWWLWLKGNRGDTLPVRRITRRALAVMIAAGIVVAIGYGALLHRYTNAYAPFIDSAVLVLSVIAQLLLMRRMLETWMFWIVVDLIAVPLFFVREIYLTSFLYAFYLVNAFYGFWRWRRELESGTPPQIQSTK